MPDALDHGRTDDTLLDGLIETIVAHAPETVVITDGDLDAPEGPRIEFVNAAAARLTGYAPGELLGQPLAKIVLPAAWPEVIGQLRKILETREPSRIELAARDAGRKDYWIELSTVPIFGPDGVLRHFVRIGRDVTARKQAEQQREATQRLLASVFAVIESPLMVADEAGLAIMSNAAVTRHLGWSAAELTGRPVAALLDEPGKTAFVQALAAADTADQPRTFEAQLTPRAGASLSASLQLTAVRQPDQQRHFVIKLDFAGERAAAAPTFDQAIRRAMARGGGSAAVVAGKLQLVGLDSVREKLGRRWPELAARTLDLAERVIRRYLQSGDIFRRTADESFLVFFDRLTEDEAKFKARAIGSEIRDRLIGEIPEMVEAKVASFAATVTVERGDATSEDSIVEALGKRLEKERGNVEAAAREAAAAALLTARVTFLQVLNEQRKPAPIGIARLPRALRDSVETLLALGQDPYGLEAEVFLLTGAGERILAELGRNGADLVVVPVRFSTVVRNRDLEAWLKVARNLSEAGRRQVVAEIVDIPRDVAGVRLTDISMRLSSLFRTVAFELPTVEAGFVPALPDPTRLVTIPTRRLLDGSGEVALSPLTRLMKSLDLRRCRLIAKDAHWAQDTPGLVKAGISLILPAPEPDL